MKTGTNKKSLSLILASLLCVALTVFGIGNLSVFKNRQAKAAAGSAVAKVGEIEYADLNDAFAALGDANSSLELLDDAAWDETTPVYWKTNGGSGYAATFAAALTASYMSDGGAITIVCRPGADVGYMTHGHVEDDLTVYGNGAYISDGECDIEVDTFPYSRTTGKQVNSGSYLSDDVTITAYKLGNLGVWGQRNTNYTVNVNLYDCDGKAIDGKTNVQRVYISGKTGVNNFNIVGCDFLTAATSLYSNADGKIVISDCSFTGSQVPVNFNHKTNGDMSLTVENCTFDSCGDEGDWKAFAAPVRFVNSADGTMGATVDGCTFVNTVGNNGDVLVGDGREGQSSNDVAVSVKNTEANVTVQQPGYYDASGNVASDDKAETTVTVSDTPYIAGDNYTTIELIYGDNVAEEDIVAAKKLYEGVAYSTNKAANEAYMALFGVTWGKGYLDVTDNSAPLYKYAGVSGSVMEVKYYVHGVMPGFTSLQSNGNNIDCTVGGNHQIARTSYSIIGINDENNNKAQITNGNVQAYVAGGYDSLFTSAGTLKIKNIEFTSKTSTTVGASATIATEGSNKSVTFAEMIIEDCVFRGRLYVYDNFENQDKMTYTIRNCTFDGTNYSGDSNAYAIFAQCKGGNKLFITGNKISGYARGINIDHANIKAEISENTISVTDTGRSCVQLSSLSSAKVTDNNLNLTGGNAITLHEKLLTMTTVPEITFEKNNVTGKGYLVYDDAAANNKAFTSENLVFSCNANTVAETVDTENGVKDGKETAVSDVVNGEIHFFKDADGVWHINNGQGLAKFAASVTKTNTYKGETVKLDCDIDMTGVEYTSAGNGYLTGFGGTFDGCEHTISNLSITESGNYSGLFYVLTGTVKNLNIINANVQGVRAAVLAGASYSCTIEHVTISNSVVTGEQKCAGLLGFQMENSTLDISDCKVENVEIKAASTKYSDVQGASFGGLVGFIHRDVKATITNNTVKNISFEGLLGEDFYAEHSIVYYQYLSHPFIGALIGTSDSGEYDSCETVLSGNKVEDSLDGLISGPTTNGFLGFYYRSDFSAKNVTKIVIDDNVVANNVVVHIGDAYYASFEDALAAAVDGDTITLLEDITVTGKQVVIDKKITIDLNGKTLKVSGYTAQKEQINVTGELTVKDSAEGGLICSDYTGTSGLIVNVADGGKFTLESGTITTEGMANSGNAVKVARGGEFVLNGGVVKADFKRMNFAVNLAIGATFTMNGGSVLVNKDPDGKETSVTGINGSYNSVITINDGVIDAPQAIVARSSTTSVTGGDFKGTIAVKSGSISGGTFDSALDYKYLADGYVLEDKGDGTYGLKEGKYIAGIDTVGYESLQAAVNAAGENAIIKLVADTTENVTIEAGKNITLNLNGFTLSGGTGTAKAAILNYGTVVIKDSTNSTGTIKREDNGTVGETSYYVILNLGTMTIESGTITNNSGYEQANPSGEMVGSSLICNGDDDPGATLYVKGGKLTQLNFIAIKNGALGNLYVTGGEITSKHSAIQNWFNASITGGTISGQLWTDAWKEGESVGNTEIGGDANFTGEIVMDITGSVVPKLNITGGTLDITNWRITDDCANAGGKPQVSGGTFASAVDESYCESGFIPTENEDGTYGVKVGEYLVKIGEVKYDSLNAAVEAAKDGDTITLIKDILLSEQVAIGKAITIDGAGYEIKATKYIASDKAGMFYRTTSARGTLTFKNVTLNGNGVSKIFINEGGAGETVFDTVVSTNGGGMKYGSGIHISGGGSHATIRNSTLTGSTGTTELNDENYYAANDLWVGGNVEVTVENSVIGTVFVNTTTAPATSVHGHLIVRGEETEIGYIAGENTVADKNGSLGSLTTIEGGSVDTIFDGGLYEISDGTFKTELKDEWLKDGFNVVENEDGTYGVKMVFYVASGYNGKVVAEFSSLDEAFAYAAENEYKFVVVSGTYVLTSDLIIPDGKFLDVTGTLTIAEGVTVTIPKTAKRLAAVLGGKIINNGTILLYGESNSGGYFMLNGGTLEGNPLTPPEGYVVDRNGSNFYVINISTAAVMVEYNDGTVRYFNENITTENAKKITLLRDFEGNFTISGTASVTYNVEIDLGGHTLSKSLSTDGGVILVSYANVVIKNGTVLSTATDGTSKPALKVNSHGNVTVADDVTLDGGTTQPAIYLEGGEVTLYGKATSKGGYAITTQGLNEHNTVITIKDGATVTAENGAAIYNPKGDLIIEGGAITGKIGVQICAGTLSISGNAQITATGAAEAHEGDGPVFDGSAVSIIDREGYAGLTSVEITGGTFTSANGTAIRAFAYKDKTESAFDNSSKVVKVKGGSFSSIPDNMDELCADGYIVSKRGTSYSVIEGSYVAMIGDVKYGSIQAAFDKARSGDTVVLLSNIVLTGTQGTLYALVDGVIIDLNGYSIDGSSVSANAANPAAFGLNVEVGGSAGVITVKNSASAQSIITGVMPMKVLSTNSNPLKLVIEGDILLNATNGGNKVELDSGVYMVADDKAKAMIVNGGFLVTVSGEERIYGQLVSALKLGEVKLMNDYVAGTNLKIRSDWGDVVLNLNGKTYSFSGYGNCFEFESGAKLTIKNGKVASSNSAFSVPEGISNVELNVEDVEITAEDYAIVTNGTATNITVSVKNSVITSSDGVAIYFPSTGSLNIVDSEITGKVGVQVCAGTLAISGDKTVITGNGTIEAAGDGSVIDGSAVSIIKRTGYGDIASVTITGGKFVSVNGTAVKAYALDGTTESAFDNSAKIVAISGGTFSGEIEASLLKDGYKLIEVNGAYGVIEKLILGASVTLGEDISFNYYVKTKTDNTVVVVKYMKNGVMTEETLTEFVEYTAGGRYAGKYVFRGITPQMIGRDITIVYTDGEAHDIIENYSVADYLEKAYTNANNAQVTKQLAADVMYYGLAAMKYRKADEADIADIQSRITKLGMTQSNVEMTDTSVREGETIVYVSVRFDNANNLVFAVKDSVFEENPSYKYYIGKTEITEWNTTLIEGYHVYTCEALKAIEYVGKTFTVKVYRADEVLQTLTTDVGSYCARIAASQTYATELKELAKATYAYGTSASAYANRSNG